MVNTSISLVNLDFDDLKQQLKTYLKSQSQFTDYDFDGSNMSVLLDILTYNTHLNAFYLNMIASEMFLDSAQLRASTVSHAKALNYTPRSSRSSKATVNCTFAQSGLSSFSIPKNTKFTGRNSRGSFQFLTKSTLIAYPAANVFQFNGVEMFEGSLINESFVMDSSIEFQRFILTNPSIDTDSIEVTVSENVNLIGETYLRATGIIEVTSASRVFFVQAAENSRYELVFGDNVFGNRPKDGAVITVSYRINAADQANECTDFILNDNLGAFNGHGSSITPAITTVTASVGGANEETVDEIKYRAPKAFQTQDRAITVADYTALVTQRFTNIKNVRVYGGEQATVNPRYGTVYIVPITFTGELLALTQKIDIQEFIKARSTIGVDPVVVDPDFLDIIVKSSVLYNPELTSASVQDLESAVKDAVVAFGTSQLTDFNSRFSLSRLESAINDVDLSVVSNETELLLRKTMQVEINEIASPSFSFQNALVPGTLVSSRFASQGRVYQYTDYNPQRNTIVATFNGSKTVITNSATTIYLADVTDPSIVNYVSAGNIDYSKGTISINPITINDLYSAAGLQLTAKPQSSEIVTSLNDITRIRPSDVAVLVRNI